VHRSLLHSLRRAVEAVALPELEVHAYQVDGHRLDRPPLGCVWALVRRTRRRVVGPFCSFYFADQRLLSSSIISRLGLHYHGRLLTRLMSKPAIRMSAVGAGYSGPLKPSIVRYTLVPSEPLSKTPTGGRFTFAPTARVKTFHGPLHVVYRHPT
jgi:hypothetical protein